MQTVVSDVQERSDPWRDDRRWQVWRIDCPAASRVPLWCKKLSGEDKYRPQDNYRVTSLTAHREELLTYFDVPQEHWRSVKTTNPIESIFDQVRLRTRATRRMRTGLTGLHLVFQLVRQAQRRWHRLPGAHLLAKGVDGATFVNGIAVMPGSKRRVAA
jgi:transposase-like protein